MSTAALFDAAGEVLGPSWPTRVALASLPTLGAVALRGDCRSVLRGFADNTFGSVVTDPPYELEFMSKKWDGSGVSFNPETWREVYRVLKPGGYMACFGGTRTYHRIACAIEDAGFELRDCVMWCFGSGMPKSLSISRQFEKGSPEAARWSGYGSGLKPAYEPIILARKPLAGTYAANVLQYGTGALNIDGCRVATAETITNHARSDEAAESKGIYGDSVAQETHQTEGQKLGRWPANLVLSHSPNCCTCTIGDGWVDPDPTCPIGTRVGNHPIVEGCTEDCPIRVLDEQSGNRPVSGAAQNGRPATAEQTADRTYLAGKKGNGNLPNDKGGASRYFNQLNFGPEDDVPFLYQAKAARKEREAGCEHLPARTGAEAVEREEGSAGVNNPRAGAGRTAGDPSRCWALRQNLTPEQKAYIEAELIKAGIQPAQAAAPRGKKQRRAAD